MAGMARQDLVRLMIGRNEQIPDWATREPTGEPAVLELRRASRPPLGHRGIDLTVRRGEIVGLYGLVGAGRSELAKAIMGVVPLTAGEIRVDGQAVRDRAASPMRSTGIAHRLCQRGPQAGGPDPHAYGAGATPASPIWRPARRAARPAARRRDRAPSPSRSSASSRCARRRWRRLVGNLSGGNQQKISVAKWLAAGVRHPDRRRADGRHRHQDQGLSARTAARAGGRGHRRSC